MGKKKKEGSKNVSGKPKHSLDVNRRNKSSNGGRSAATIRRIKMYKEKPKRNRSGKIIKHPFQNKDLPNTRIAPDRRWFTPSRVVTQEKLETFREEMERRCSPCNVIIKRKKLPMSHVNGHQKVGVTNLQDASVCIREVLKHVEKEHLVRAYKINDWKDEQDFLVQLCKSTGKLLRGGEPDYMTAAKTIRHDWQRGKIPFFVPSPVQEVDDASETKRDEAAKVEDLESAVRNAIEEVISSQPIDDVPV